MTKKNILLKSILFVLILLIIAYGLNCVLITGLRKTTGGDLGIINKIMRGEINAEVLISGSSRALVHFDCDIIGTTTGKTCYNMGLNGSTYEAQLALLEAYLKNNRDPDIIIQVLGSLVISNNYDLTLFFPYLDKKYFYQHIATTNHSLWKYRYIPLYGFAKFNRMYLIKAIKGMIHSKKAIREKRIKGYWPRDKTWNDDFEKYKKLYPNGRVSPMEEQAVIVFRKILKLVQDKGSDVILVAPPFYYESYALCLNKEQLAGCVDIIAGEYHVPVWRYDKMSITKSKEYFYNASHLNRKGATIFSQQFSKDLQHYLKFHQNSNVDWMYDFS